MGGLRGNSNWACAKASMMSFGVVLNFCLNSLGMGVRVLDLMKGGDVVRV